MKRLVRRGLSAAVCTVLAGAGAYLPSPAQAAGPAEVAVIPADALATYRTDLLWFAGETGFLHQRTSSSPVLWTRYGDRVTTVVPELAGLALTRLVPAGGDTVSFSYQVPGRPPSTVSTLDLASMTWRQLDWPASRAVNVYGDHELVWSPTNTTIAPELRKIATDGSVSGVPLSGLPPGAALFAIPAGDASSAILSFRGSAGVRYGLLDLASGRVAMIPAGVTAQRVLLTDDRIGLLTAQAMNTYARADVADGAATDPVTIPLPPTVDVYRTMLAGDDVIVAPLGTSGPLPALRYSASDPTPTQAVPLAEAVAPNIVQAHDGVVLVGGAGPADWAVRRVTGTGQSPLLPLSGPLTNAGLTIAHGLLRHVEALTLTGEAAEYHLYNHAIAPGSARDQVQKEGGVLAALLPCETGATCARMADGNWYGTLYVGAGTATTVELLSRTDIYASHISMSLPSAGGAIVDASGNYAIVRGTDPARQYVAEPGYNTFTTGPVTGAGLWFDTLWTATTAGHLQPKDLPTGAAGAAIATGAGCQATEVQATGRYVYWSCGASGPAGVYDLTRKTNIPLPAARYLLGDGYVVRHDGGDLVRYDLGTGDTATLATVPRGSLADDRNVTWAVDKYSGDVAYVDGDDAVHLVDPGVARSAPAAGVSSASSISVGFSPDSGWVATFDVTRPIDSWQLTVARAGTGKVVATATGGPARSQFLTQWNGYVAGKRADSGRYRYTVTATAGGATAMIGSGVIDVGCGTPEFRSYDCNGRPSILGITKSPAGNGHWLTATLAGTSMQDGGFTDNWNVGPAKSQFNAIIPFGDITQDYLTDLLVRRGDGSLRAYLGIGQAYFGANKSIAIAGNFSRYNALVYTGDVTGDGHADLIGRDSATGALYRYAGNGKGGFTGPVKLAGTYKGYGRIVGAGDFTGDGKADLLLQSGSTMYGLYGNGNGTFGGRFQVSTGWLGYNTVIGAGDVNDDGRNDLVTRDNSGNLWLLPGNGHGGVGSRVKLGAGYQKYAALY